ncbi:PorT family protein [Christiangramia sediminis]|uniref:PorT family protein n=1 Tax=Christiangramia sediminis TaxID=2881336 RepID=A0A9X1RX18_9FLAO|nr:PorT family protein [Christiangramia sediminis]MCB7481176.1 PorT family protein [Christiangramia sediminis]
MKTIILYIAISILGIGLCEAQTIEITNRNTIELLKKQRKNIIVQEKEELKVEVESINEKLDKNEITLEEANELKEAAAKKHALNIENRVAIIDNKIALIERNEEAKVEEGQSVVFKWEEKDKKERSNYRDERTTSTIMLAAGFNNALKDGQSLNDSDFKIGGSRFFEIGWVWNTRVFEDTNWLRLKYGVSFQFNGLKPTDNRYFIEDEGLTFLEEFPTDLKKSKFRMDNLVIPVHFEFGPYKRIDHESGPTFSTYKKFKVGLGGYAGFSLGERQKLKFEEDGDNVKQKLKSDYNTNDFIYGLSGYIGWGNTSLYAKYDLNPIFQEPNAESHNVSLGLRFDLD